MRLEKKSANLAFVNDQKEDSRVLINAAAVLAIFGGITEMTLWRWLKDEELNFPKPIVIQKRRYWREAELMSWIDAQGDPDADL
ncbi:MAG: hypothetical protein AAGI36_00880 [Pseudomonadota bacterium]